ncbi:monovalent cation/H+ antiporter complex subunit F [Streptomyces triticisoli]|uniref:monovalent cation/H+ antiporter complex subunit F n=1 Tax=Streptomyces triticisoli TaxID=2182797 RepID=UPI000DDA545A|nr:monovalent cation/H+ antiporter complex subunit F [Streptomyces triticisoli]
MRTAYLWAAFALICGLGPLAAVCRGARPIDGLVAVELGGAVTTLALVCLAVGYQSSAATGAALVTAVMSWVSGMVMARFLDRLP